MFSLLLLLFCPLLAHGGSAVGTVTVQPSAVSGITPNSITVIYTPETAFTLGTTITMTSSAAAFVATTTTTPTITVGNCILTDNGAAGRSSTTITFALTAVTGQPCTFAANTAATILVPAGLLIALPASGFTIAVSTAGTVTNAVATSAPVTTVAGAITGVSAVPRDSSDANDVLTPNVTPGLLTVGFTPNVNLKKDNKVIVTASGATAVFLVPTSVPAFSIGSNCQATWTSAGSNALVATFTLSPDACLLAGGTAIARSSFKIPAALLATNPASGTTVTISVTAVAEGNVAVGNEAAQQGKYTIAASSTNSTQSPAPSPSPKTGPSPSPSGALGAQFLSFGTLFASVMVFALAH